MNTCKHKNKMEDGYFNCWYCPDCNEYIEYEEGKQMSVNINEIKVGDLVEYSCKYSGIKALGVVTEIINKKNVRAIFSDLFIVEQAPLERITGHWKVINFEEETNMKETFTGLEAIKKMIDGEWIICEGCTIKESNIYSIIDEVVYFKRNDTCKPLESQRSLTYFFKNNFEVYTPQPQFEVGKYYVVTYFGESNIGKAEKIENGKLWAKWGLCLDDGFYRISELVECKTWREATPEEIKQYERTRKFIDNGREVGEFRVGDIVKGKAGTWYEITGEVDPKGFANSEPTIRGKQVNSTSDCNLLADNLTLVVPTEVIL